LLHGRSRLGKKRFPAKKRTFRDAEIARGRSRTLARGTGAMPGVFAAAILT
jgi:hypothetical protein